MPAGHSSANAAIGEDRLLVALDAVTPAVCGCPDCLNAAGVLAYLVDLLDYAVRHIRENGQPVDLTRLSERFHQPFADLPASCDAVDTQVLQARIAVEVLRAFLPEDAEPDWYLQLAYEGLLRGIGTSLDELRTAQGTAPEDRVALAERIGIHIPPKKPRGGRDELDELLDPLSGPRRSEDGLEQLFGLRSTHRSPLDGDVLPACAMATGRRYPLRLAWTEIDHPANASAGSPPLIDPDQLGASDFADLSSAAFQIFTRRSDEVGQLRISKKQAREQFGLDAVLGEHYTSGLWRNTSVAEVISLADQRAAGDPVDDDIAGLGLTLPEFDRLAALARLNTGQVIDAEWEDVYAIFVMVEKRGRYPAWRAEEEQAPAWIGPVTAGSFPILVEPSVFRIRPAPSAGGVPWVPTPWRSDAAARQRWERTLRLRTDQERSVLEDLRASVAIVEESVLPQLRDWLIGQLIGSSRVPAGTPDRADWLTRWLGLDFEAGPCVVTTRVVQAITTMQSLIYDARHGLLEDLTLTLDAPYFDEEWAWLGSYASWRAAMLVFLYPESTLRPTLRRAVSPAFARLVGRFPTWASADAASATTAADDYASYFADVCSLALAGLMDRSQADPPLARRVVRIARATETSRLYASAYTQLNRPSGSPAQPPVQTGITGESFWDEIPGMPRGAEVIGLTAYRGAVSGPARIGMYVRWTDGATQRYRFTSTDGTQWWPTPVELDGPPGLVRTGGLPSAAVPDAQPLLADLDGSGRPQIVVMAPVDAAGSRLLQVLVEDSGGLVLRDSLLLPPGFRIPDRPVVFRRAQGDRLLVVEPAGGVIGVVGKDPATGQLRLLSSTAAVPRADGTIGWPVGIGSIENPTVFVSANIDGTGDCLLAFERMATGDEYAPVGTSVAVCDLVRDSFVFRAQQVFQFHLPAREPQGGSFDVRWDRFVPVASGYGMQSFEGGGRQDIMVHTVRTTFHPTSRAVRVPNNEETRAWLELLRWDPSTSAFVLVPGVIAWGPSLNAPELYSAAQDVPGLGAAAAWPVSVDDEFMPIYLETGPTRRQAVLVRSRSRGAVGVLVYTGITSMAVTYHATGSVGNWAIAANQSWTAADVDGDARDELIVADPNRTELALLRFSGDAQPSLDLVTKASSRVDTPDQDLAMAWPIGEAVYTAGDLDGDGMDEVVVRGPLGRMGLLRTVPPPVIPSQARPVRPEGVTLLRIEPKRTVADLAVRKGQIRQAYDATIAASGAMSLEVAILDEAYYFVHIELGLRLFTAGSLAAALDWYAAVYDYGQPLSSRKIADKLVREERPLSSTLTRADDWLDDPLDPHAIAATRPNAYSRFTILTVVRCLLALADTEYTHDSVESVARARDLYLAALDLLRAPELAQRLPDCSDLVGRVVLELGDPEFEMLLDEARSTLGELSSRSALESAVNRIEAAWDEAGDPTARVVAAHRIAREATEDERPLRLADVLEQDHRVLADAAAAVGGAGLPVGDLRQAGADIIHPSPTFCVPPDPSAEALRRHAELALRRMRSCRTISGLQALTGSLAELTLSQTAAGEVGSGAARPFQPLPYPYATLVERGRQLVQLAAQIESSMLDAIEHGEAAAYDELRARQDLALQVAGVRLKELEVKRADDSAGLALLQQNRAIAHRAYLTDVYNDEYNAGTIGMFFGWVKIVVEFAKLAAGAESGSGGGQGSGGESEFSFSSLGGMAGATVDWVKSYFSLRAKLKEIKYQQAFADRDVEIAGQQLLIAGDNVQLAQQDQAIAQLRADNAQAVVDFLAERFTGPELYDWMSGVLQDVYRFFLQQATSMARLAEDQLAFERQELVPRFIQDDYWSDTPALIGQGASGPDRRGLTGSARLLRDLVALDDYAFRTTQQKLQLSRTFSLVGLDPLAFARFRRTGVMHFATPTSLFDQDFPGHYMRLVKRVRMSIMALAVPSGGFRATLATTGTSYVVTGVQDSFQRVVIQRGPETVALATTSTGSSALDPEPPTGQLGPFENIGVDTTWRLSLPRPANPVDFAGIVDVFVTIDYSALDSIDLRSQVIDGLDRVVRYDRAFSLRYEFADQWADLTNVGNRALSLTLRTERARFAANVDDLVLRDVTLAYLPVAVAAPPDWATSLQTELSFVPDVGAPSVGGRAAPVDGIITTLPGRGNAAGWQPLTAGAVSPVGEWTLQLSPPARGVIDSGQLSDIALLLSYEGTTSPWPEEA